MTLEFLGIIVGVLASGCSCMFLEWLERMVGGGGSEFYGSTPDVPKYPTSKEILDEMLKTNTGALPDATALAGQMDASNLGNWQNQVNQISPSFMGSMKQAGENIASRVRGEIDGDAVQRSVAARSFLSGTGGGTNTSWLGNLMARDIGMTEYQTKRQGEQDLERFGGVLKSLTPTTDVRSLLLSTPQVQNIMEQKWNEEWLRAKVEGAPDPVAKGRADEQMALLGMVLSIYSGGPGYQRATTPDPGGGGGPAMSNADQQQRAWQAWNYGAPPPQATQQNPNTGMFDNPDNPDGVTKLTNTSSPWGGGLWE